MGETLTGVGDVHVKSTKEHLGRFAYVLTPADDGTVTAIRVDLGFRKASWFLRLRESLILRIEDGRCIEFLVATLRVICIQFNCSESDWFSTKRGLSMIAAI
jgi:hypothetical protein